MKPLQETVWNQILEAVEQRIGSQRFELWMSNTRLVSLSDGFIKIGVPNLFIQTWLEERLLGPIKEAAQSVLSGTIRIEFIIDGTLFRSMRHKTEEQVKEFARATRKAVQYGLSEKMKFERFVRGKCNKIAYLSALNATEKKFKIYNPLFIYGASGKTHLLQAIAHKLRADFPELNILYVTADKFATDFTWALRNGRISSFRSLYRKLDALIIDDIHNLETKQATLEELLHTVDSVLSRGGRVITSSAVHLKELQGFKKQLVGRLTQGMVAKIEPPDLKTRQKVIELLVSELKKPCRDAFSRSICDYIAGRFADSMRELIGAFTRLAAYVSLSDDVKKPLNVSTAKAVLGELLSEKQKEINLALIADKVSKFFGLSVDFLTSRSRRKSAAIPRQICVWLARRLTESTLSEIGSFFGGRSHSATLFADRKVASLLTTDQSLRDVVTKLEASVRSGTR